jgi:type IV pilus assembly protein PilM
MATDFSVAGEDGHKKALLQAAIRKFGLNAEENLAAPLLEALKQGKGFAGCIVGDADEGVLTLGEEKDTHFVLPADGQKALLAIGELFNKIKKDAAPAAAKPSAVKPTAPKAPAGKAPAAKAPAARDGIAKSPAAKAPVAEKETGEEEPATEDEAPEEKEKPTEKPAPARTEKPAAAAKAKPRKKAVGVWGIDLGECGLKAIRLVEEEGQVVATAFDFVEHPKILSQPDADRDQLTREALDKFLSRNSIKGDIVCISVPGQSGLARFVKLPPVEEKKIGDIVRFEAKQQIPFNLDEVVWDYQKLGSGVVTDGFALDTEIGLFAIKRDAVNKSLQHFKDVAVDIHIIQMSPLALCNFVAYDLLNKDVGQAEDDGKREAVVALDIGTDSSNLVITDGGRIIWQRPIPLGGNHFTRALTKDLKLTFAKAEHLKRNAMKSPELKKILAAIKPVLSDFVSEVQRSLGYFTNTHRDVQIQYMVGLGNAFRLPGLQRFLAEKLQLDVRKLDKLQRLKGSGVVDAPVFTENLLSFAVAYGLALQGLQKARLLTNLLPQEIRMERLIKAKKPFAVAAAAVLLLSVAALAAGFGAQWSAYGGKPVVDAKARGKKANDAVKAAAKSFEEAKEEAEKEGKAIDSIVGGRDEQSNLLYLTKFIDESIPRPEDAFPIGQSEDKKRYFFNLPDVVAWEPKAKSPNDPKGYLVPAQEAYSTEWLQWRRGQAAGKNKDELGGGIDRLIQFNVEAVSFRYATKLSDVWAKLPAKLKTSERGTFILPESDLKNPPGENDKGWVVELRGYTYHNAKNVFVIDMLMQNMVRRAAQLGPKWPIDLTPPAPVDDKTQSPTGGDQPAAPVRPISHVILFNSTSKDIASASVPFELIDKTKLGEVVGSGTAAPAGGGTPPANTGGSNTGSSGPTGSGGARTTATGGGGWTPLGSESLGSGSTTTAAKPPAGSKLYSRTEFVIFFFWREPTEVSDNLLTKKSAPASNTGGPGGQGAPPNVGPGGNGPPPNIGGK